MSEPLVQSVDEVESVESGRGVAAVVVLAAAAGTRMKSQTFKLLHPLCGRSLLSSNVHAQ